MIENTRVPFGGLKNTERLAKSFVVYLSSIEFKDQRRLADGGYPNRCQGAADIQIHLRHLLATSGEITSKSSLGESTPIYPTKCSTHVYTLLK